MNTRQIAAPILVGAGVASVAAYRAMRSRKGPRGNIGLTGDSYAQGIAAAVNTPPALPAGPGLDFRGGGVPGAGIEHCDAWIDQAIKEWPQAKWVVISCGTNDYLADWPTTAQHIMRFAAAVHASGAAFCWVAPPPSVAARLGNLHQQARFYRAIVGEGRYFQASDATIGPLLPDGLHPQSFRPWAEAFWSWIAVLTS
jgi:hypothetical protein